MVMRAPSASRTLLTRGTDAPSRVSSSTRRRRCRSTTSATCKLSIRGTLEIATARAAAGVRTLTATVDDHPEILDNMIQPSIDLTRFRVAAREFNVSRDKRTLDWELRAEELPPMSQPAVRPKARGRFTARNTNIGMAKWKCSLKCTYTRSARTSRGGCRTSIS